MLHMTGPRRTAPDLGADVMLILLLALDVANTVGRHDTWRRAALEIAVSAAVCTLAVRRHRSVGRTAAWVLGLTAAAELATWLGGPIVQPGAAACAAVLLVTGAGVRDLRPPAALAATAAGGLVALGTLSRYRLFLEADLANSYTLTRVMLAGWVVAVSIGLWLRLAAARRRSVLDAVRRAERLELARELHDAAAHHLTGLVVQTQAARITARKHPGSLDEALAGIEATGAQALTSLRQVIGLMRDPDDGAHLKPGPETLPDLVARFTAARGTRVQLTLPDGPPDPAWPREVITTVHRTVQEALTNIARHATTAREITVTVAHDPCTVRIVVTDDGTARTSATPPGYGLAGMRERIESLGGTLEAGPRPGQGWAIHATLPTAGRP
jgi:signal transduction histidine kinase